ncbi:MAG: response regulator receiver protein [Verrucomicrobiales bacterium]|nr:response regulator receiver protein [Verrucomicrobiales bacterium]
MESWVHVTPVGPPKHGKPQVKQWILWPVAKKDGVLWSLPRISRSALVAQMSTERVILLVEDDRDDVWLFRRGLKENGAPSRLFVVQDGEQALHYLYGDTIYNDRSQYPLPNVLVLDLRLPRLSGLEVLRLLHNDPQWKNLPILVVASCVREKDIVEAYTLGVNCVVEKQVDYRIPVEMVCKALDFLVRGQFLGGHCEPPPPATKHWPWSLS